MAWWDINRAKAYCESMIPQIEEYRREHGYYPAFAELDLGNPLLIPHLLRDEVFYARAVAEGDQHVYGLFFLDPRTDYFCELRNRGEPGVWYAVTRNDDSDIRVPGGGHGRVFRDRTWER